MKYKKATLFFLATLFYLVSIAQKYNAEVLDYQTDYTVKGNEVFEHILIKIRINKHEGDKYSKFAIPYDNNAKIVRFDAWVEGNNGKQIKKLKKSEAFDRSAFTDGLYTDHFIKIFQLTVNDYPHVIVLEFERTLKNIMSICDWNPGLYNDIPVLKASLSVTIPKAITFKKLVKGRIDEIVKELPDGSTKFLYSSSIPIPLKDEVFALPGCNIPSVNILPLNFTNENSGSWESWQTYGSWISKLNEGMDILPNTEKVKVDKLISGVTNKKEITKILYHYMQDNTRYINVTIGIGSLMPYPAEYVCKNRYGDCKALTNYMKALLLYAGIESYYCVVNAGNPVEVFETAFSSHQFNHAILAVPFDTDTIWLENTSNIVPFGYMGTFTQNRPALLVNGSGSKLVKIPALSKQEIIDSKKMEFNVDIDGNASVKLNNILRGDSFDYYNALSNILNQTDRDTKIRNLIDIENTELVDWQLTKKHRDSSNIELTANLKTRKVLNSLGSEYFISITSSDIPLFTNAANRSQDVMLSYPVLLRDTLIYNLPEALLLKDDPEPLLIESEYGNYSLKIIANDHSVSCIKEFELYPAHYTMSSYPDFYKFMQTVYKAEKSKLIIKHL